MSQLLIPYSDFQKEVTSLDFIPKEATTVRIICPHPSMADDLREVLLSQGHHKALEVETMTLGYFIKERLKEICPDITTTKWPDIKFDCAAIWKIKAEKPCYESFDQAFELFKNLRKFTLDVAVIEDLLENYDSQVAELVILFWQYLGAQNIVDDNTSIVKLTNKIALGEENLSAPTLNQEVALVFLGFSWFTAHELDLLKELARKFKLFFPVAAKLLLKAKGSGSNWITWLFEESVVLDACNRSTSLEDPPVKAHIVRYSKYRLSENIHSYFKQKLAGVTDCDVFLATSWPDLRQILEIPLTNKNFKTESHLFQASFIQIRDELMELLSHQYNKKSEVFNIADCVSYLDQKILDCLQKNTYEDFRILKIMALFKTHFIAWGELSAANERLAIYDFKVVLGIVEKKLPKTFNSAQSTKLSTGAIKGLEGAETFNPSRKTMFCVNSSHRIQTDNGLKFNEASLYILASIGPLPDDALEEELMKLKIMDILSSTETTLFLEEGIEHESLFWGNIWEKIQKDITAPQLIEIKDEQKLQEKSVYLDQYIKSMTVPPLTKISASKLQTYMDCPRKFYFTYIENFITDPIIHDSLPPKDLGIIEHEVIEKYYKLNLGKVISERHDLVVASNLEAYILKNKLKLNQLDYRRYFIEIKNYTCNALRLLFSFKKNDSSVDIHFEHQLKTAINKEEVATVGRIDCLVRGEYVGVLDFKRSSASIPTRKDVEEFYKIQLLFYMLHSPLEEIPDFWGYICLADISKSLIWVREKSLKTKWDDLLQSELGDMAPSIHLWKENFESSMDRFMAQTHDYQNRMTQDKDFSPAPRTIAVCQFCHLSNICTRK